MSILFKSQNPRTFPRKIQQSRSQHLPSRPCWSVALALGRKEFHHYSPPSCFLRSMGRDEIHAYDEYDEYNQTRTWCSTLTDVASVALFRDTCLTKRKMCFWRPSCGWELSRSLGLGLASPSLRGCVVLSWRWRGDLLSETSPAESRQGAQNGRMRSTLFCVLPSGDVDREGELVEAGAR